MSVNYRRLRQLTVFTRPPATKIVCPVMYLLAGEASSVAPAAHRWPRAMRVGCVTVRANAVTGLK